MWGTPLKATDNSFLSKSLAYAADLVGATTESAAVAVRIMGDTSMKQRACIRTAGESAPDSIQERLEQWALSPDSDLDRYCSQYMGRGAVRLPMADSGQDEPESFRQLQTITPMTDGYFFVFSVNPKVRCVIVFLQFGAHPVFTDIQIELIDKFIPAISQTIRNGHLFQAGRIMEASFLSQQPIQTDTKLVGDLLARLSKTEHQILDHLRTRATEREVAAKMDRSPHTVHVHVKSIYRKLMVTSRAQLLSVIESAVEASESVLSPTPCEPNHA
jgi:DNA-binding NarL/FixJ family response regulator